VAPPPSRDKWGLGDTTKQKEMSQIAEITICYSNVLKNIRIAVKQKKQVV